MIKNVLGGCLVARVLLFTRVCAADFSAVQEEQIEKLEVVGEKVVALLDQLDEKIVDLEISSQLIEKQEEINVLITQQQEAIERVETTQEIRDILEETKNRIVLKTYDGITHRDPLTETVKVS